MSEENQAYKKLKENITKAIKEYTEETNEMVCEVSIEIDEDEEYAQITPYIGKPEYTEEAKIWLFGNSE